MEIYDIKQSIHKCRCWCFLYCCRDVRRVQNHGEHIKNKIYTRYCAHNAQSDTIIKYISLFSFYLGFLYFKLDGKKRTLKL